MPKTLRGPTSPVTAVFREIVRQIQDDPVLFAILGNQVYSWDGSIPFFQAPTTPPEGRPWIQLTPRPMSEKWWLPGWKIVVLGVDVAIDIWGSSSDDFTDLWTSLMAAIQPADGGAFMARLVAAGAMTGQVHHTTPAIDRVKDTGIRNTNPKPSGIWELRGQFQIEVVVGAGTLPVFAEPHPDAAGATAGGGGDVTAGGDPIVAADATALPAGTSSTLGAP